MPLKWLQETIRGYFLMRLAQVEAGATMLDVNAGIPMADEPAILAKAIKLVQEVPLTCRLPLTARLLLRLEAGLVSL